MIRPFFILFACTMAASPAVAFDWPGGSMTINVTCQGNEEFAGYSPSSPWGSTNWVTDPILQLRDSSNNLAAQQVLSGGAADWMNGGSRSATISFTVGAGSYTLAGVRGTRHQLIADDGWSGWTLNFGGIADPVPPAPPNSAPSISWTSTPGTMTSGQSYAVSARGTDADGNLTNVNVYRDGLPFAFAGGGDGNIGDSGNSTSDLGPLTVTYTAEAIDAEGARSGMISQTVVVSAPVIVTATIGANPVNGSAPMATTVTWTSADATAVTVSGPGLTSGSFSGTELVVGLPQGAHVFSIVAQGPGGPVSNSVTVAVSAPANRSPTIAWSNIPGTVADGQSYFVSAGAHDDDGNLVAVNVWKNGAPFAFAGGGNGTDGDSGNSTADSGPASILFTAQAVDATGASSPLISQAVLVQSPPALTATLSISPDNTPAPGAATIAWSTTNAVTVSVSGNGVAGNTPNGSVQITNLPVGTHAYVLNASGAGGPLTRTATLVVVPSGSVSASLQAAPLQTISPGSVTLVWTSANATSVSIVGPGFSRTNPSGTEVVAGLAAGTHTFSLTAQGPGGPVVRNATVTVTMAPNVAPTIVWNSTPGTVASGQVYTVSARGLDADGNLAGVNVLKNGIPFAAAGGGNGFEQDSANSSTDGGPASVLYAAEAIDAGGLRSAVINQTVLVAAPATVTGTISANPDTCDEPGTTTIAWTTANASTVSVVGPGLLSTAVNGSQAINGLTAGSHSFVLTAQGSGGPITRTVAVLVRAAPATVTASISVVPTTIAWSEQAVLTWSSSNATAVAVTGTGIGGGQFASMPNLTVSLASLPVGTHRYSLVAQGLGGPIARIADVVVTSPDGVAANLTLTPSVISSNESATLGWNTTGTGFRRIYGAQPSDNTLELSSPPDAGAYVLSGLNPGNYAYTLEYGPDPGFATRSTTAFLTVLPVSRTVITSVSPIGAGSVTGAGAYLEGSIATLSGNPAATHDFSHWSGDLNTTLNPLAFAVGRQNYRVVANFVPRTFTVAASVLPTGGGTVVGAGSFPAGSTAILVAAPAANHVFTGWSGDASGSANPLSLGVTSNLSVTAHFVAIDFTLTTAVSGDGTVTPGGIYAPGTLVTIAATPGATARFTGWTGDATGTDSPIAVRMDRDKVVQANFLPKSAQFITFPPFGDRAVTAPPFGLLASASSGLPVSFAIANGPAFLTGAMLQITGAGSITVRATQDGDALYLPAPPVEQTFNAIAPATLRYRGEARTLLQSGRESSSPPRVIQAP